MPRVHAPLPAALLGLLVSISFAHAQTPGGSAAATRPPMNLEDVMAVKVVGEPALSPDGSTVLFTVQQWQDADGSSARVGPKALHSRIWTVGTDARAGGSEPRRFGDDLEASAPAWAPDGRSVSVIAGRGGSGKPQIWVMNADGSGAAALTSVPDGVTAAVWSPDSTRIAFTTREPAAKDAEDRRARGDDATVFEEDFRRVRLWVIDVASKRATRVAMPDALTVKGAPVWSPDATRLALIAAPTPLNRDHRDALFIVTLGTQTVEKVTSGSGPHRTAAWSPDGTTIAFAFQPASAGPLGDGIVPQPIGLFHLMLLDVATRQVRDVASPAFDRNAGAPLWSPDSRQVIFSTEDGVYQEVFSFDVATRRYTKRTTGKNIVLGTRSRDGATVAFTLESTTAPAEI
jgi:Tol biopolymer transport system component